MAQAQEYPDAPPLPALKFDSAGNWNIIAPVSSSKTDFDFLLGKNKILHRVLKSRLTKSNEWREYKSESNSEALLGGTVNMEVYKLKDATGQPYEGMALRTFDVSKKLWSIYWLQSNTGLLYQPPQVGYFENQVGFFFALEQIEGKNTITAFRWDARNPKKPVWSQATSLDKGKTWEWNWYMIYDK